MGNKTNKDECCYINCSLSDLNNEYFYNEIRKIKNKKKTTFLAFSNSSTLVYLNDGVFEKFKNLKKLHLTFNNLKNVSDELLTNLTNLEDLHLNNNDIRNFPNISKLSKLTSLLISNNKIQYIPENTFSKNCRLTKLLLNHNQLEELPNSIGNLKSLNILLLNNNFLKILPDSIGNLKSLLILNLYFNNLQTIPLSIGNLYYLITLNLNNNNLKLLPNSLLNLNNLETLNISFNELTYFPFYLLNLKELVQFYFKSNLFLKEISHIDDQELKDIMKYININKNKKWKKNLHKFSSPNTKTTIETILLFKNKRRNKKIPFDTISINHLFIVFSFLNIF